MGVITSLVVAINAGGGVVVVAHVINVGGGRGSSKVVNTITIRKCW